MHVLNANLNAKPMPKPILTPIANTRHQIPTLKLPETNSSKFEYHTLFLLLTSG